jgi:hypothetical protein
MERQFAGRDEIRSKDLKISHDEDFILLILGTLKHDEESCFYRVEFGTGYIFLDGYRIPDMKLIKKEKRGSGHVAAGI